MSEPECFELAREFRKWRREQGLSPGLEDMLRLQRWLRLARRCGQVYAPWMEITE